MCGTCRGKREVVVERRAELNSVPGVKGFALIWVKPCPDCRERAG